MMTVSERTGRTSPIGIVAHAVSAVLCLFGPFILLSLVWRFDPLFVETRLYEPFTGMENNLISGAVEAGEQLTEAKLAWIGKFYLWRTGVEAAVRFWNAMLPGIALAGILAVSFLLVSLNAGRRLKSGNYPDAWMWLDACIVSGIAVAAGLLSWPTPGVIPFAAITGFMFMMSFTPVDRFAVPDDAGPVRRIARFGIMFPFLASGIGHILAPPLLLGYAAEAFFPSSQRARRTAVGIGRILALTCGLPLLCVVFLSMKPEPLADGVISVLKKRHLYAVQVDTVRRRLIVANSQSEFTNVCYALDMDAPSNPPVEFVIPSAEVQNIILDPVGRRIYHTERMTGAVLAFDADTLTQAGAYPGGDNFKGRGSTLIALSRKKHKVFTSWEEGGITSVDLSEGRFHAVDMDRLTELDADDQAGLLYLCRPGKPVCAMDMDTLAVVREATRSPKQGIMAISAPRRELYVVDQTQFIPGDKVWVYSTPGLELLRKLPMERGGRAVAYDDIRGLLVIVSYLSGNLQVINAATGETVVRKYVGKRCRRVALDTENRRAFVSLTLDGLVVTEY